MPVDAISTPTFASESAEIQRRLAADGYVHIAGVIDPSVLDAVEAEMADALRVRAAFWRRSGRTAHDLQAGAMDLRDLLIATRSIPGFTGDLLTELDITLPHAPFAVVTSDDVFHLGPAVLDLVTNEPLLDLLAGVLGDELIASANQHFRIKLPTPPELQASQRRGAEAATLWHQDVVTQMPEADDSQVVTCWIAGHDTDERDGCLTIAPRRHGNGLLPWPFSDEFIAELETDGLPVPARRGDIILMDKHTPHASLPNASGRARWSFDLRYHPADQPTDRPWYPAIPVRSRSGAVVSDAAVWRDRWEAARRALVADGRPLPGRPEWARPFAEDLISSWASGSFPRARTPE